MQLQYIYYILYIYTYIYYTTDKETVMNTTFFVVLIISTNSKFFNVENLHESSSLYSLSLAHM